jgi:hypothetical protein
VARAAAEIQQSKCRDGFMESENAIDTLVPLALLPEIRAAAHFKTPPTGRVP